MMASENSFTCGIINPLRNSFQLPQNRMGLNISFSGDIQGSPGQGPLQPAVGDPTSAGGLD